MNRTLLLFGTEVPRLYRNVFLIAKLFDNINLNKGLLGCTFVDKVVVNILLISIIYILV